MSNIPKPENSKWTDDQWRAIVTSGKDVLVAAAAGSGKTAVLVERIIKKVTSVDEPVDVDRLLIVTFTNAAAAEMRKRIGEALEKEIASHPSSLHLRKQLTLLNRASISTLHSFCLNVLRKYYYKIELDPGFRIADSTEAELLMEEVMEELFEEQYSIEENEQFFDLVDRYSNDRSDLELQLLVRKLYDFSRSYPWPDVWLDQIVNAYRLDGATEIDTLRWMRDLKDDIKIQLSGCQELLDKGLSITKEPGGPAPYAENLLADREIVEKLHNASELTWSTLFEEMAGIKFSKLKPCRGSDVDKQLQEKVKAIREQVKGQITKLQEELFSRHPDRLLQDLQEMEPVISKLIDLVKEFSSRYQAVKKEKAIVDFADLEHYCLDILKDPMSTSEELVPSEVAQDFKELFQEVLVDEYQDTNLVQETIIRLISCGDNLFMVGDVKQSIYRFRLAEPQLFLMKYKKFAKDLIDDCEGVKIDLSKNFRSRAEVLDGTNFIFKQIMNETVGEIEYDEDAELKLGNESYPVSTETSAELLLMDRKDPTADDKKDDNDEESELIIDVAELEAAQLEGRIIGQKIRELIEHPFKVIDHKGHERNVTYRDIVILLRSMPWAETIMDELKEMGIPVYAELSTGYFDAVEVSVMMSLLKVIDNPFQDIPLVSVLRSPICGLSEEELSQIRINEKHSNFYEAVKMYMKSGPNSKLATRIQEFNDNLKEWRNKARQGGLAELIWQLYRETGYYDYVGGMPGGKQRQANLRALYDRAKQYEETSFRGLFRFLRFVERMQDRGEDLGTARALGEQEDVVRMMTIHKSKGLEFPVVFVAGLGRQFNMQDLRKKVLLHKELGFGSKLVNPKLRISYPTLPLLAIKRRMQMELLAEEMRVLYVALTRAKEKLYLLGTVKDGTKTIEKWRQQAESHDILLPDYVRSKASSYLDWIGPALIRHKDSYLLRGEEEVSIAHNETLVQHPAKWWITLLNAENFPTTDKEITEQNSEIMQAIESWELIDIASNHKDRVFGQLTWKYPYEHSQFKRSKQSVSEIKSRKEAVDSYSDQSLIKKYRAPIADRPKFLQEKSLTAAEKGTAMHMVMQHIDLTLPISERSFLEQIDAMVRKELLTKEQAEIIDLQYILAFFDNELGQRLVQANMVRREVPFSLALPANEAYPDWLNTVEDSENVLIQGVIDCIFEDDRGFVLIDYKTDSISGRFSTFEKAKPVLENRYRVQVELYSRALREILKIPVVDTYLYFFDGGNFIKM